MNFTSCIKYYRLLSFEVRFKFQLTTWLPSLLAQRLQSIIECQHLQFVAFQQCRLDTVNMHQNKDHRKLPPIHLCTMNHLQDSPYTPSHFFNHLEAYYNCSEQF
uniref:Uncharacterized protein n=1 Tax=Arundo donax TaxID=35708 RepID=A0A0A9F9U6_ARUDO